MLRRAFSLIPLSGVRLQPQNQKTPLVVGMLVTCLRHLPYIQNVLPPHPREQSPHSV